MAYPNAPQNLRPDEVLLLVLIVIVIVMLLFCCLGADPFTTVGNYLRWLFQG